MTWFVVKPHAHCHSKSQSDQTQVGTAQTTAKAGCSKERHCAKALPKEERTGTTSLPDDGIHDGSRRTDIYRCGGGVRAVRTHARPSGKVNTTENSSTRAEGAPHAEAILHVRGCMGRFKIYCHQFEASKSMQHQFNDTNSYFLHGWHHLVSF